MKEEDEAGCHATETSPGELIATGALCLAAAVGGVTAAAYLWRRRAAVAGASTGKTTVTTVALTTGVYMTMRGGERMAAKHGLLPQSAWQLISVQVRRAWNS